MNVTASMYELVEAELQRNEKLFRNTFNHAPVGIAHVGVDGRWLHVNPKMCDILGYSADVLLSGTFQELTHPDDLAADLAHVNDVLAGIYDSYSMRKRYIRRDTAVIWTTLTVRLVHDDNGEPDYFISVVEDISPIIEIENALQSALEKEKELNELKSRFVSMASHEFRTPLATILAMNETLQAYRHRMADEQIEQRLQKMRIQIDHLTNIMEDILQLSQMQARKSEFNPCWMDLNGLCGSVIDEFSTRADIGCPINFRSHEELGHVYLDRRLMRQIVNNLLSNAIKYSPNEEAVSVTLDYQNDQLLLSVIDQGIGIPEEDIVHLFEPFHRALNVGTLKGTGLGLTIVKESVELHGGTIELESQVGEGTTFLVTIPLTSQ